MGSRLFYIGIVIAVIGLLMLLLAKAALGLYVGSTVTIVGLVLFGMGLRGRLKDKNPTLGNVVLIVAIAAAVVLAYLAFV
jgi:hypothetical protein